MIRHRQLYNEIKPYLESTEAVIVTGMRRTGKTSLLSFIYDSISNKNKLFLDLENPINRKYFEEENYDRIKNALELLGIDFTRKVSILLDEIQLVKNIPSVVKYFIDHYSFLLYLLTTILFLRTL